MFFVCKIGHCFKRQHPPSSYQQRKEDFRHSFSSCEKKLKYFITITFITFKRAQFIFTVRASDRGTSALHADVEVELVVVDRNNKPPIWDQQNYGPIYVKENAAVGSIVTSVKARFVLGLRQLRRPKLIVLIETR